LEANLQRDKHARLTTAVNQIIDELTPSAPDFQLRDACDQLVSSTSYSFTCVSSDVDGILKKKNSWASCPRLPRCRVNWSLRTECLQSWKFWKDGDLVKSSCGSYRSSIWLVPIGILIFHFSHEYICAVLVLTAWTFDSWSRLMQAFWRVSA
jgi:hypothetical protein